ncbi:hypothetical protein AGMMS49965_06190 [Bacteroidia bacterium]|nr:hypothetical protein AGMMS49965_06190 [Bacteroidia bacterium]
MKKLFTFFVSVAMPMSLCAETWYVSNSGSDEHSGSSNQPFLTISKGAEMAQPGDTVFVFAGIYRERVSPPRGGVEGQPIVYYGEPGKRVYIKGSDVYTDQWEELPNGIYAADLNKMSFTDDCYWDSANPFQVGSSATPYSGNIATNKPGSGYTLGQVFVEGEPYMQRPYQSQINIEGCWWYDPAENAVRVRFKNNHSTNSKVEITTRRRIFAPHQKALNYIHVIGFIMEHCGNQFPDGFWRSTEKQNSQAGALGLRAGNYWLVKNNVVRYAAGIGIDCGALWQNNERDEQPECWRAVGNVIENNYLLDNGSNGIAGTHTGSMVVRGNVVMYNNNYRFGSNIYEQAGMKFHNLEKGLITENYVANNFTYGIWLDNLFPDARITRNVIVNNERAGIFLELADYDFGSVLIDHNVVMNNKENQIYMHDAGGALYVNNLISGSVGNETSVVIRNMTDRSARNDKNAFYNNMFCNNVINYSILYPIAKGGEQRFLGNLYDNENRVMHINNYCDSPNNPFSSNEFNTQMASELGASVSDLVSQKVLANNLAKLTPEEWKTFWSAHSTQGDSDYEILTGLSAVFIPETQTVSLTVPGTVSQRLNDRWDTDYKEKYQLTESQAYPGPFDNLTTGTNDYQLFPPIEILQRAQLPGEPLPGEVTGVESPKTTGMPPATLYPNPGDGHFTLKFDAPGAYHVTISDISGRNLWNANLHDTENRIDISSYPAGIYLLAINSGGKQSVIKVIKK